MVCILKLASKVHCVYNYKQDTNIMLFININVFVVHLRSHMINSISAFVGFTDLNFFFFPNSHLSRSPVADPIQLKSSYQALVQYPASQLKLPIRGFPSRYLG